MYMGYLYSTSPRMFAVKALLPIYALGQLGTVLAMILHHVKRVVKMREPYNGIIVKSFHFGKST
jgi:hypothetical protein